MPAIELPRVSFFATLICLFLFGGCAANAPVSSEQSSVDPWESTNRKIDNMNTELDHLALKPVAEAYTNVVPEFLRHRVSDFYGNLNGPINIINNFLQGDGAQGFSETGRFLVNSTFGIFGLFDVASKMGLEEQSEDFGQTFAVWGVPRGPYVIVPFFGPHTLRDALALPLDFIAHPLFYYENTPVRYSLYALRAVDIRAGLLSVEGFVDNSFDRYVAIRESYLQHRRYEVYDGNPPMDEDFYDDFLEDLPEPE